MNMAEMREDVQGTGTMGIWHRHRLLIVVAVIGVAVALAIIGWLVVSKDRAVKQAEEDAAGQRAELVRQAEAQHADTVKQSLIRFGVPLAWAIRREMMANNLDQVDQYVADLVRMEGIQQVTLAQADGAIVVASDRKNIGTTLDGLYAERYMRAEQIEADETAPGQWLLVLPVMGLNARLGTVVIEYQAPPFALGG
jgi:type II secretory pathway pseudopilin PulG